MLRRFTITVFTFVLFLIVALPAQAATWHIDLPGYTCSGGQQVILRARLAGSNGQADVDITWQDRWGYVRDVNFYNEGNGYYYAYTGVGKTWDADAWITSFGTSDTGAYLYEFKQWCGW